MRRLKNSTKIDDQKYAAQQYKTAANLNARVSLHERFSVNRYGWQRWVFDQIRFPTPGRILELGCGPAYLWRDNLDRLPPGCEILLTDFSEGMIAQARDNLGTGNPFQFQRVDAQEIPLPFETGSFEVVIANHMLYHLPYRSSTLADIHRILVAGGKLYASTVGERHLVEIHELIHKFDPTRSAWGNVANSFKLENGAEQLSPWFEQVNMHRYIDSLEVTEVEPLVEYILSGWSDLDEEQHPQFFQMVEAELNQRGGVFHITKDSGMFQARKGNQDFIVRRIR